VTAFPVHPWKLTRSLLGGILITAAYAMVPHLVNAYRMEWLPTEVIAADSADSSDGLRTIAWKSTPLGDRLETFKTRGVFYTGLPLIIDRERLRAWDWLPHMAGWQEDPPGSWNEEHVITMTTGWPWRAVIGTHIRRTDNQSALTTHEADGGLLIENAWRGKVLIPYRPWFAGLFLDIALWTAVLHVLAWAAHAFRSDRRRRRGRCAACGHPVEAAGGTCPECGKPRATDREGRCR
jgi:hypothetical protein